MTYTDYTNWVTRQTIASPIKAAFITAGISGLLFGLFTGLQNHSAKLGILEGIYFGIVFGIFMALFNRRIVKRSFKGSNLENRLKVIEIVRKGKPIDDVTLAPDVERYATETIRQLNTRLAKFGKLMLLAIGPVLSAIFLITAIVNKDIAAGIAWVFISASYAFMCTRFPKMWRKNLDDARDAQTRARALLQKSPDT